MTRLATVINKIIDIINTKQPTLVSGENIKKLNGTDIVGSGNIPVKTVGGESILGDGDVEIIGTGTLTTSSQNVIGAINELDTDKAEQADLTILTGRVSTAEGDIDALDTRVTQAEAAVGTPLVTSTVAGMTDQAKIYVYTGHETGYTSGNWYYWNGSAWTSGGVYNSTAFETDTTLALSGKAADAKVTGDEIADLKSALDIVVTGNGTYSNIISGATNTSGAVVVTDIRLRTSGFIFASAGQKFKFTPGSTVNNMCYYEFTTDKVYKKDTNWYSTTTDITIQEDCLLIFVFRNSSNADLSVSDYDATISVTGGRYSRIDELKNAESNLKDSIEEIREGATTVINIIQGSVNRSGAVVSETTRIRSEGLIRVNKGEKIIFTPSDNVKSMYYTLFNDDKSYRRESSWISTDYSFTVDAYGYIVFVYKNAGSTRIYPSDYDATTKIIYKSSQGIETLDNAVFTAVHPPVTWVIGNLNPGGAIGNSTRSLRFGVRFLLPKGTKLSLKSSGYGFNLARFSSQGTGYIDDSYKAYTYGETAELEEDSYVMASMWHTDDSEFEDTSESTVLNIEYKSTTVEQAHDYLIEHSPFRRDFYYAPFCYRYYHGRQESYDSARFNTNTQYNTLISAYDELLNDYPEYITKHELELSSDGVNHLYSYDLRPLNDDVHGAKKLPKILVISGQHGFEKASVFGLYYFIKDLCEKYGEDEDLRWLRTQANISFIPCVNPYGFNNNIYTNANQVNLNRNWDRPGRIWNGEIGQNSYGGEEAFSEPETRSVRDFILANSDAIILTDFHTQGGGAKAAAWNKVIWIDFPFRTFDEYYNLYVNASSALISTLTYGFMADYAIPENAGLFGVVTNYESGYGIDYPGVDGWCTVRGIVGHTLEGSAGFPTDSGIYTPSCLKYNSEILGNWLLSVISFNIDN